MNNATNENRQLVYSDLQFPLVIVVVQPLTKRGRQLLASRPVPATRSITCLDSSRKIDGFTLILSSETLNR